MALENKKLSSYDDLASANIDTTTKLVVLTGATKVNSNLPVVNFIEDTLTSTSTVKPLSAKQGKALQDTKAPIANPTFTGAVNGITKAMVGLGDVDNTSDANKPISSAAQAAGLAPKANPVFTGNSEFNGDVNTGGSVVLTPGIGGKIEATIDSITYFRVSEAGVELMGGLAWILGIPTYADNTAALAGGLTAGRVYKTSTGVLMITY